LLEVLRGKIVIQKIKSWLSNPFVNISIAILIGFVFYKLSVQSTELSYSVSKTEEFFSQNSNNEDIVITDKNGSVISETIYLKRFVLWNSGEQYIEKQDFFKANPLQISLGNESTLISSGVVRASRDDLRVDIRQPDFNTVVIQLGDDALESGDGIVISLLFTGEAEPELEFTGRVRGIASDFNKVAWVNLHAASTFSTMTTVMFMLCVLLGGAILTVNGFTLLDNRPTLKFITNSILGLACGLVLFTSFSRLLYAVLIGSSYSVGWL
ncbi:hypothetical protein ACNPFM_004745, partial [Vibrio parahaemolyticus]